MARKLCALQTGRPVRNISNTDVELDYISLFESGDEITAADWDSWKRGMEQHAEGGLPAGLDRIDTNCLFSSSAASGGPAVTVRRPDFVEAAARCTANTANSERSHGEIRRLLVRVAEADPDARGTCGGGEPPALYSVPSPQAIEQCASRFRCFKIGDVERYRLQGAAAPLQTRWRRLAISGYDITNGTMQYFRAGAWHFSN